MFNLDISAENWLDQCKPGYDWRWDSGIFHLAARTHQSSPLRGVGQRHHGPFIGSTSMAVWLLDSHCCNIKRPDLRRRASNPVDCSHIGQLLLSSKNEAGGESASQRYHQKCNTSIDQ